MSRARQCAGQRGRNVIAITVIHSHNSVVGAIVAVATEASERERGVRGVSSSDFGFNSGG